MRRLVIRLSAGTLAQVRKALSSVAKATVFMRLPP